LPEIFGMHANAQISYLKNESHKILSHVLNVQPRISATGSGVSGDTLVLDLVKTLQDGIPELIDTETYHKEILKTNA
jgi:dynein heavy chain